jgi:diphthine-ammonia ligase
MKVKHWTFGIAFVASTALEGVSSSDKARIAHRTWNAFHRPSPKQEEFSDEPEEFDIWHLKHGAGNAPWQNNDTDEVDLPIGHDRTPPTLLVIEVDQLPRASAIEWVGYGLDVAGDDNLQLFHLQALVDAFRGRVLPNAPRP